MSRDSLLRTIAEAPEDDTARLVFADWLDEYGDELDRAHAELIRVQIAREHLPLGDDRRAEFEAREERLSDHGWNIRRRLGMLPRMGGRLSRGFPESVGFDWNDPRKGHLSEDDLILLSEVVRRLPIRTFAGDVLGCATSSASVGLPPKGQSGLELLAAWPDLARLTTLEVTSSITPYEERGDFAPGLLALAESPYSSRLRRLRLGGWQVDPEALAVVASSPNLSRLAELDIDPAPDHFAETIEAVEMLVETPLADRLERLWCDWVEVPAKAIRNWLDRASLYSLAFGVPEAMDGVGPLIGSPALAKLRQLRVTGEEHGFFVDEMPNDGDRRVVPHLSELLASSYLTGLESLSIRGIALGDDGLRALAEEGSANSLVELDLSLCGLTGKSLQSLRSLLNQGRLRRLWIGHNALTDADAEEVASWPEFRQLHQLSVGYFNAISDAGFKALRASAHGHPSLKVQ